MATGKVLHTEALRRVTVTGTTGSDGMININSLVSGVTIQNLISVYAYKSPAVEYHSQISTYGNAAYVLVTSATGAKVANTELSFYIIYSM